VRDWLSGISYTNFYLTYQAHNDLQLQRQYAEFVYRVMAASYPQWVQNLDMLPPSSNGKIRVGYISPNLKDHSGVAWAVGWLKHRDRDKFEVYSYFTDKIPDEITAEFEAESDYFRHVYDSIDIAVRLATDSDWRHRIVERMSILSESMWWAGNCCLSPAANRATKNGKRYSDFS
jgi:predicted O-linked N-acetylglucosamine transferase (SPINDLY family)